VHILHCDAFSRFPIQKLHSAGWRRPIQCLKLQAIFRSRATDYEAILQKMTYKDKVSHDWSLWFEMGMCVHTWHGAKSGREVTGQLPLEVGCHHLSAARHREVACRALFGFHTHTQQTIDTHAQTRLNVCTERRVVHRCQWGECNKYGRGECNILIQSLLIVITLPSWFPPTLVCSSGRAPSARWNAPSPRNPTHMHMCQLNTQSDTNLKEDANTNPESIKDPIKSNKATQQGIHL